LVWPERELSGIVTADSGRSRKSVTFVRKVRSPSFGNRGHVRSERLAEARERLAAYFDFCNRGRLHQSLDYLTPDEIYFGGRAEEFAAAA
jgi:hypothetical protein